jgi:hypothetical protein
MLSKTLLLAMGTAVLAAGFLGLPKSETAQKPKTAPPASDSKTLGKYGPLDFPKTWPAPLARPAGSLDQVADILATKIMAGGPEALPALQRAALESGFAIHGKDGNVLYSPDPAIANGISMLDLDLVVAVEGVKRQVLVSFEDLQKQLDPELSDFGLALHLYDAVSESSQHKNAGRKFWSSFMVELSMQSDGPEAMSLPQSYFMLYMGAGQAWAGSEGAEPETEPETTPGLPEAEEPPPHGPLAQAQARDASFGNLRQSITSFSDTAIAEYMSQNASRGRSGYASLLRLARQQALMTGTELLVRWPGEPLVKRKVTGQEGESDDLFFSTNFDVTADFRERFEAARAFLPRTQPLPPNGPLEVNAHCTPGDRFVVRPNSFRIPAEEVQVALVGTRQTRTLPTVPLQEDLTLPLEVKAIYNAGPSPIVAAHKKLNVAVRDWLPTGLIVEVDLKLEGSGTLTSDDHTLKWTIYRSYFHRVALDMELPSSAMISLTPFNAQQPNRFKSWMNDITKQSPFTYGYVVREVYTTDGPASGCGTEPGERSQSWTRIFGSGLKSISGTKMDSAEWDSTDQRYGLATVFNPVRVTYSGRGTVDREGDMAILTGVELPPADQNVTLTLGNLKALNFNPSSGLSWASELTGYDGWAGNRKIDLTVNWKVKRQSGGNAPLSESEYAAVIQEVQEATQAFARKVEAESSTYNHAVAQRASIGGQLWVGDPSAASCDELVMSDALPTKSKARR